MSSANQREGRIFCRSSSQEMLTPKTVPSMPPNTPIAQPWTMKILRMLRLEDPIARRMPMSRVFSMTVIISVLAILNAATRIINASIITVTRFSNFMASNRGACVSTHVLAIGMPRILRQNGLSMLYASYFRCNLRA